MGKYLIESGKGYEFSISPKMIFKKMYCCKCGKKLSIKLISIGYDPDKKWDHYGFINGSTLSFRFKYRPKGTEYFEPVYTCKHCNYIISYDAQKRIREYQDAGRRHILTENEINSYNLLPKDENIENI